MAVKSSFEILDIFSSNPGWLIDARSTHYASLTTIEVSRAARARRQRVDAFLRPLRLFAFLSGDAFRMRALVLSYNY
jgi:hypothetical protein